MGMRVCSNRTRARRCPSGRADSRRTLALSALSAAPFSPAAAPRATIRPSRASNSLVTTSLFELELPQSLIDRAKAGDLDAFERIYRRFERPAYTLALRVLNDAEAAREVLHDAMLKVFQRIGQYRSDAPFWAWLRQIALNEALMRLRRERHPLDGDDAIDAVADEAASPSVRADALALERALGALPALTRSVLWLYHVEGYSHPEIAEMVGKTVSFSKSQVARGTARLRVLLDVPPADADGGPRAPATVSARAEAARANPPFSESVSCLIETPALS